MSYSAKPYTYTINHNTVLQNAAEVYILSNFIYRQMPNS